MRPRSLHCGRDRWGRVKKLGYRDNDLGRGKGLCKQEAVRDTLRRPLLPVSAGHVDDGHRRIGLAGRAPDLPSIELSPQVDVGHDRPVFGFVVLEKRNCFLAGRCQGRRKAAVSKRFFGHSLNKLVVLDDQNRNRIVQSQSPPGCLVAVPRQDKRL
jgi:hypothetical protein